MRRQGLLVLVAAVVVAAHFEAQTPAPRSLRVIAFSGVPTISIRVAEARGLFARRGLSVQTDITPNSPTLREGLAEGKYDIAHAAVDNAIAMVESAGVDVVIVMGGDNSMNELIAQPEIGSIVGLRSKTVIVDAPDTAYALQARKILSAAGLREGDYTLKAVGGTPQRLKAMLADKTNAATMLNPPFSIQATRRGLRSLGAAADLLGSYQGMGAFVRREWAQANRQTVVDYLSAFVEAQRWFMAPENRMEAVTLLESALGLEPEVATETYERGLAGLAPDAKLDVEGLRSVLRLRAEVERQWGGRAPDPATYFDTTYHDAALAALNSAR